MVVVRPGRVVAVPLIVVTTIGDAVEFDGVLLDGPEIVLLVVVVEFPGKYSVFVTVIVSVPLVTVETKVEPLYRTAVSVLICRKVISRRKDSV